MATGLTVFFVLVTCLALLNVAAAAFGVDSRDGFGDDQYC
jgi:hypothetical protein